MINKSQCLSYDDVLLVPQYSDIRSREEIDISSDLGKGISLRLPVLSSPMDTVTAAAMANCMNELGGAGVIHRYCTVEEQAELILSVRTRRLELMNDSTIGAAIGVTGDFMERSTCSRRRLLLYRRRTRAPHLSSRSNRRNSRRLRRF